MNKIVTHKLYMFSESRFYIGEKEAILLFKTVILPIIEYCDIIYEGASVTHLDNKDYNELQNICQLCNLTMRRKVHLRNVMYKQQGNLDLINRRNIRTRLHDAIVFILYKPNSEKSR